jgi:hypothetical protein
MRAGGGDLQSSALGRGYQFTARAMHFDAQLADVFADFGAGFDYGLMHFVFHLLDDIRRSGGNKLHDVRTQRAGCRVNDLELFFNTDSEAVSHGVALRMALVSLGTSRAVSYSAGGENTRMAKARERFGLRSLAPDAAILLVPI